MYLSFLAICVLLCFNSCLATKGVKNGVRAADTAGSPPSPIHQGVVGLTAVVGFLGIVFILLILKRLLRKNRVVEEEWGYDNKAVWMDEDDIKQTNL